MVRIEITATKQVYYKKIVEVDEKTLGRLEKGKEFPLNFLDGEEVAYDFEWLESDFGVLEDDLPSGFEYKV